MQQIFKKKLQENQKLKNLRFLLISQKPHLFLSLHPKKNPNPLFFLQGKMQNQKKHTNSQFLKFHLFLQYLVLWICLEYTLVKSLEKRLKWQQELFLVKTNNEKKNSNKIIRKP